MKTKTNYRLRSVDWYKKNSYKRCKWWWNTGKSRNWKAAWRKKEWQQQKQIIKEDANEAVQKAMKSPKTKNNNKLEIKRS